MNAVSIWLLPLYLLYRAGWWIHFAWKKLAAPPLVETRAKVISIGGVEWGGSAKTTLAIELARYLIGKGKRVAVLSRGYGRSSAGVMEVDAGDPRAAEIFGDEPTLIAREVPGAAVWVGADRAESARAAEGAGAVDAIVLDDGLQVMSLRKDLDIVALDPDLTLRSPGWLRQLFLRTPLWMVRGARVRIYLGSTSPGQTPGVRGLRVGYRLQGMINLWTGDPVPLEAMHGATIVPFCGIARPDRFIETLQEGGLSVAGSMVFPDHHLYRPRDFDALTALAENQGATTLVTTTKDAIRFTPVLRSKGGNDTGRYRFLAARTELSWHPNRSMLEIELDSLWKS